MAKGKRRHSHIRGGQAGEAGTHGQQHHSFTRKRAHAPPHSPPLPHPLCPQPTASRNTFPATPPGPRFRSHPTPHLQHALEEVPLPPGKAAPVGQDEQWQALPVKLLDGLGRLVGRVGPPHLEGGGVLMNGGGEGGA